MNLFGKLSIRYVSLFILLGTRMHKILMPILSACLIEIILCVLANRETRYFSVVRS